MDWIQSMKIGLKDSVMETRQSRSKPERVKNYMNGAVSSGKLKQRLL